MTDYKMYINGKWIGAESYFETINPTNEKRLGRFPNGRAKDVELAVAAAQNASKKWSRTPPPVRGQILFRVAELLRKNKKRLGMIVATEMGKVLPEALGDVQEAIDTFEYFGAEGRRLFGNTTTSELEDKFAMTIRRPVGVCGLITPWNFPVAIPAWKLAPALICGNTVVLKPSSDTPLCAYEIVKILIEAGVPPGVVNFVTGTASDVGQAIVTHKEIECLSFTGSKDTGEWITANAGLKKIGMELGGKNPIIVMDDADLELAVEGIIWGAFGTTGQRCTACSRVIVQRKIKERLLRLLVERTKKLKTGNPILKTTDVGPLINKKAVEKVAGYVEIGKNEGAKLVCGGEQPKGIGYFFRPTVFDSVEPDMRIAQEEIFGPVLSVLEFEKLDDAIEIANNIEYGLSSSIYTKDIRNAFVAIEKIDAGLTYINSSTIGSEVHLPFGGVKKTGHTKEAGIMGLDEFSNVKTIYFDYSGKLQKAQIDD